MVVLGVTGSIAAYKAAELARALVAAGAEVQAAMTHSAAQFLGPLTLETLTRRKVQLDALELLPDSRIGHIVAADTADLVIVAPATARWMAAMAGGLADDVVTAICLATAAQVVVAPAMDGEMWSHPATRANVDTLRGFGYAIVEPEEGPLASGSEGRGRLAETAKIMAAAQAAVTGRAIRESKAALRPPLAPGTHGQDLEGRKLVVSAGGTAEPIDPVRFIGNRSSGRMGIAIAEAALDRGARVTLVAGSVAVPLPEGRATVLRTESTAEMRRAVLAALPDADVLIMAAAVADFRPAAPSTTKLTRDEGLTLALVPTEDILAEAARMAHAGAGAGVPDGTRPTDGTASPGGAGAARRRPPILVGFAAETGSLDRAAEKAARKGVDLMVANDVSEPGSGFAVETNRVTLIAPGAEPEPWPLLSKREVADRLLDRVVALLDARDASAQTGAV
ncbi:MAG: bifunctional phosphopantothenoylcysteine decarboxylase/phosphopantothenate--cysteine ligase CoaBC, partial [Candidatus Limnocylindrales bacterium]